MTPNLIEEGRRNKAALLALYAAGLAAALTGQGVDFQAASNVARGSQPKLRNSARERNRRRMAKQSKRLNRGKR